MRISDEELDRLEQLSLAATPGPWTSMIEHRDHDSGSDFIMTGGSGPATRTEDIELIGATRADQEFIAAARNALPALVLELREARRVRSG